MSTGLRQPGRTTGSEHQVGAAGELTENIIAGLALWRPAGYPPLACWDYTEDDDHGQ